MYHYYIFFPIFSLSFMFGVKKPQNIHIFYENIDYRVYKYIYKKFQWVFFFLDKTFLNFWWGLGGVGLGDQ